MLNGKSFLDVLFWMPLVCTDLMRKADMLEMSAGWLHIYSAEFAMYVLL